MTVKKTNTHESACETLNDLNKFERSFIYLWIVNADLEETEEWLEGKAL